ncbi:hypothetical protein HN371_22570 [Candidatus Poribacteria bacterium]|jgi:hypothetical protein|nr:hypothetical protein [Candidatus Poribacteria bacterium]MBT5713302.1 hypothetical protein [Candidatus Poribacteria bacterium]MBT7099424.1 hypothetical protein [Candidatus Poribacteria bacterium]MBT7804286.1 hypothetical protein [Candidatus Poribacteria bacterium]
MSRPPTFATALACLCVCLAIPPATANAEDTTMDRSAPATSARLLSDTVGIFHELIGRFEQHGVAASSDAPMEFYLQPCVYLSLHLVQMREAGWDDIDYDHIAAVSGASALFAYEPDSFDPKYANLSIGMDDRIADATGFGYAWTPFSGAEGAWRAIVQSVDAGRSVKGWDWENILFAGYEDAGESAERRVYAMTDGPGTYSKWLTWEEFGSWVARIEEWGVGKLGSHTERVPTRPAGDIAARVLGDLVAWSDESPQHLREKYPDATFGLAGIELYAEHCADMEQFEDFGSCHGINPLWCHRNSSAAYLRRVADEDVFAEATDERLTTAANEFRAAYLYWKQFGLHLTHGGSEGAGTSKEHREEGASALRKALAHEKAALAAAAQALEGMEMGVVH